MKKGKWIVFLAVLVIFRCHSPQPVIRDLVHPLRVSAGKSITVPLGDLFYAETYPVEFLPHPHIQTKIDPGEGTVTLTPDSSLEGLTLLAFRLGSIEYQIPIKSQIVPSKTFTFKPKGSPEKVTLFGSFNSWNRSNRIMTDTDGDGVYSITLPLDPGRYEYRFWVDGQEFTDPSNPDKSPNPFGEFNSVVTIKQRHEDTAFLHKMGIENGACHFLYTHTGQSDPLTPEKIIALADNQKIAADKIDVDGHRIRVAVGSSDAFHTLRIAVTQKGLATPIQSVTLDEIRGADEFAWNDAILYSIVVDRFCDGNPDNTKKVQQEGLADKANYFGGDLQGILNKLENGYFTDLGVNVIWLSPIVQNTWGAFQEFPEPHRWFTGYHGYWPIHHEKIDERFGDMPLFKKIVDTAHARGIKVLLDFVANHVHQEHPFFQNHPEWFGTLDLPDGRKNIRFWDEYRLTTWFDTFLPSFDFEGSEKALQVMTDNAVWWLKETGVDGFRQDAVKHIPNRFWRVLNRKINKEVAMPENRTVYQIGETFGSYDLISSYVNNGQLSAQFNFQIYDIALPTFLTPGASFAPLDAEMHKSFDVYGMNHLMGHIMDSHDKVRFLSYADGDLALGAADAIEKGWNDPPKVDHPSSYQTARLYLAFLLSIPGIPVIYYGDEIGITGAADPDNRRPMRFGEDVSEIEKAHKNAVTQLISLRRDHSALRRGDFLTLKAERDLYAYLRSDMTERVLVVLNKSQKPQDVTLNLPGGYGVTSALDLSSGKRLSVDGNRIHVIAPARGWAFLELK